MMLKMNLVNLYIFTPTYNREKFIKNLYESLLKQKDKSFIWLVVDDGSTDDTEKFIGEKILENKINIKYLKQINGGKHTAYNTAIEFMEQNSYHVCVDSDDYLSDDAVENFHKDILYISNKKEYIGIVYPKVSNSKVYYKWVQDNVKKVKIPDFHYKYNLKLETCILINNNYLSGFKFESFENEKFLSEGSMYIYLSKKGYFYPFDKKLYYYEYLNSGLTRNIFKLWEKNIKGTLYSLDLSYDYVLNNLSGISKIKSIISINMNKQALLLTKNSFYNLLMDKKIKYKYLLPFSIFWKKKRFKK